MFLINHAEELLTNFCTVLSLFSKKWNNRTIEMSYISWHIAIVYHHPSPFYPPLNPPLINHIVKRPKLSTRIENLKFKEDKVSNSNLSIIYIRRISGIGSHSCLVSKITSFMIQLSFKSSIDIIIRFHLLFQVSNSTYFSG